MEIEQFLDLVASPDKYKKALDDLKAEQARLQAVIETVGKVSEIDKLRKQAEATIAKADKTVAEATQKAETLLEKAETASKEFEKQLLVREQALASAEAEATAKMTEAQKLSEGMKAREKAVVSKEQFLVALEDSLRKQQAVVEEKMNKLKSIGL